MDDNRTPNVQELLIPFVLGEEISKRVVIGAEVSFQAGQMELYGKYEDAVSIYLELYSVPQNQLENLCYNRFYNIVDKKQHQWKSGITKITRTIYSNTFTRIDLTDYSAGIQEAVSSGNTVVIKVSSAQTLYGGEIETKNESITMSVVCKSIAPKLSEAMPNGTIEYVNEKITFSWLYDGDGSEQASAEIGWSSDYGETWNTKTVTSSESHYTFEKETFPEGNIRWRVKAKAKEGLSSKYLLGEFEGVKKRPSVDIVFPNNVNIPNEKEQIFLWKYKGENLPQEYYTIEWSSDQGKTWKSVNVSSSECYHAFPASTFPTGTIIWKIQVANSDGYMSGFVFGQFNAIGQSEAPIIESISQEAIPLIEWSASDQEAYEIRITGEDIDFKSGMIFGTETRSFRPNTMIPDGTYVVRARIFNKYGILSDWGECSVVMSAKKPNSYPTIMLQESKFYGASLVGKGITGTGFWVRKEKVCQNVKQMTNAKRTILVESTYVTTGRAWNTMGIEVGRFVPEIEIVYAEKYFTYEQEIKAGDVLRLCSGWYVSAANYKYSDRLVITNGNRTVIEVVSFNDLDDLREYTFNEDGWFFLCAICPSGSGIPMFEIDINRTYESGVSDISETIIAKYEQGKAVVDCRVRPGKTYAYVLRDCIEGYTESGEELFVCDFEGIIIHDAENVENMVHIFLSEKEYMDIESNLRKNTVYKQCIGREFPVKETNNQKMEEIIITGFLNTKQYDQVYEMYCEDKTVLFRSKDYCCYADISGFEKEKYFEIGYIAKITFTRLDEDNEVKLI